MALPERGTPAGARDRLVFGSIAALFGAIVGVCLALVFLTVDAAQGQGFDVRFVLFGGAYFFVVGAVRGAAAGEVFGEGASYFLSFLAAAGHVAVDARSSARTGTARASSAWILAGFLLGVLFLALLR